MKLIVILSISIIVIILLLNAEELFTENEGFRSLTANQFQEQLSFYRENKLDHVLLDIRTNPEFNQGHLKGAEMLDFYGPGFKAELQKLDRDKPYLIYCRSGNRTGQTLKLMEQLGFTNVADLHNGIISWVKAGFLLE